MMSYIETMVLAFLIQLISIIVAQSPTLDPTYEPHPSMIPTPGNYQDFVPTSFPTNEYHWNTNTTIAVSIGSIIGGSAVIAAGYFAYSRGLFAPDTFNKGVVTSVGNTTSPMQAPGDNKNPEMFPLLSENKA